MQHMEVTSVQAYKNRNNITFAQTVQMFFFMNFPKKWQPKRQNPGLNFKYQSQILDVEEIHKIPN